MYTSNPGDSHGNNRRNNFSENEEDNKPEEEVLQIKMKNSDQLNEDKEDEEYNVPEEDISDEGTPSSKLKEGIQKMNFEGMMK
jgi:hypothetical protein